MSTYPKSPREMSSGMMWFPRLVDKIRLHARGALAEEYHENLGGGMDKRCVGFLQVDYSDLRERVLQGGRDEEVLEWCFEKGRRLSEVDLLVWNSFVSKFGWNDQASGRLEELKEKFGLSNRADIVTIPDLLDLDEKRRS
jgi:gluconokinase